MKLMKSPYLLPTILCHSRCWFLDLTIHFIGSTVVWLHRLDRIYRGADNIWQISISSYVMSPLHRNASVFYWTVSNPNWRLAKDLLVRIVSFKWKNCLFEYSCGRVSAESSESLLRVWERSQIIDQSLSPSLSNSKQKKKSINNNEIRHIWISNFLGCS